MPSDPGVPADRRDRFEAIAKLITAFGDNHLDPELTGFAITLWARICRQQRNPECLRGKAETWAASVVHVFARMNFLFDKNQPVHLTLDTICDGFGVSRTTIGAKATTIERGLKLSALAEPGLCRRELLEQFTMIQNSSGMVLTFSMAKSMGYLVPDAQAEDFL